VVNKRLECVHRQTDMERRYWHCSYRYKEFANMFRNGKWKKVGR